MENEQQTPTELIKTDNIPPETADTAAISGTVSEMQKDLKDIRRSVSFLAWVVFISIVIKLFVFLAVIAQMDHIRAVLRTIFTR